MEGSSHNLLSMHSYGICLEMLRKTTVSPVSGVQARFLASELGFGIRQWRMNR